MWVWGLIALLLLVILMTVLGGLGGVAIALALPALALTVGVIVWAVKRGTRA